MLNDIAYVKNEQDPYSGKVIGYYNTGNKKSEVHTKTVSETVYGRYGTIMDRNIQTRNSGMVSETVSGQHGTITDRKLERNIHKRGRVG